jgi:hypothetical protein
MLGFKPAERLEPVRDEHARSLGTFPPFANSDADGHPSITLGGRGQVSTPN